MNIVERKFLADELTRMTGVEWKAGDEAVWCAPYINLLFENGYYELLIAAKSIKYVSLWGVVRDYRNNPDLRKIYDEHIEAWEEEQQKDQFEAFVQAVQSALKADHIDDVKTNLKRLLG